MKTIGATEFKQKCLALLKRVAPGGIVITRHGRPVAKLVPVQTDFADFIGSLKGKVRIRGDILSTGRKWNAESGHTYRPAGARRRPVPKGKKGPQRG